MLSHKFLLQLQPKNPYQTLDSREQALIKILHFLVAALQSDGGNLTEPKVRWTTRRIQRLMKLLYPHRFFLKLSLCDMFVDLGVISEAFNVINLIWPLPLKAPYFEIRERCCNKATCLWDCKHSILEWNSGFKKMPTNSVNTAL